MRLVRNSASQADADQIGQIEFYGKVGSGSAIREYAGIKAVLNDVTPSSYDGQLDFYIRKNSTETELMSLTPTTLELTNGTDLDVDGSIKTDLIEGSQYYNSSLNFYDTATQGGSGTTLSSTAGLSFKYDTNDNDNDGFKVFGNGNSTACFTINNSENVEATGSITATNGFVSSTGSFTTSSGHVVTNVGNISTNGGNIIANSGTITVGSNATIGGNIFVNGTVDGRDVAADGAKIDAIGRFGYGDAQAVGVSGTTTHTMLTFSAPAPTSGTVVRSINGSVKIRFYLQNTQTPPRNVTFRTYLEMQSTSSTGTSIGTATYSSTPSSYNAWYYVSGNKTDVISPMRGRVGTSSTGANSSVVLGCYYDASSNRTYIRISKYPDAATAYNNVEIFYSPTNFYSTGTYVAPYLSNDNNMRLEAHSYYDSRMQHFNEIFPRTSSALYLRMRHRNVGGSTGVSIIAYNNQGYIEATP